MVNSGNYAQSVYYLFMWLGAMIAGSFIIMILPEIGSPQGFHLPDPGFLALFMALFMIANALVWRSRIPYFQQLETYRLAAARGEVEMAPLAPVQLTPNDEALSLPFTIKLRPRRATLILGAEIGWLLSFGFFSLVFTGMHQYTLLVSALAASGMVVFFGAILKGKFFAQIDVSEAGITIRSYHLEQRVRWADARFFALFQFSPFLRHGSSTKNYELSGQDAIVRWTHVSRKISLSGSLFLQPRTSYEEYDRQMEALLALIAAKTGLPLYDLREE